MSHKFQPEIDYHAARAFEEIECAERTTLSVERDSHRELGKLHAGHLVAAQATVVRTSNH